MRLFCLILALTIFASCEKNNTKHDTITLQFRPRVSSDILALSSKITYKTYADGIAATIEYLSGGEVVKPTDYVISLYSGDNFIDTLKASPNFEKISTYIMMGENILNQAEGLAPSIPALENELKMDYQRYVEVQNSELFYKEGSGVGGAPPKLMAYRTTGVKDFAITSTSNLFGAAPGTSLNNYFSIRSLIPAQVINYETKQLAWGYTDNIPLTNLSQWLSLKPTAQPLMFLQLNSEPPVVPDGEIDFIVSMTLENDTVLRDTISARFIQ